MLQTASPSELQAAEHASTLRGGYIVTRGGGFSLAELNAYASTHRSEPAGTGNRGSISSGFDYGDAAVGAGITSGIVLLLGAAGLTVRRHRQLQHP
jgi:hypothetical protein